MDRKLEMPGADGPNDTGQVYVSILCKINLIVVHRADIPSEPMCAFTAEMWPAGESRYQSRGM